MGLEMDCRTKGLIISVAYWLKNNCVEVNADIKDRETVMTKFVDLMDEGGNIDFEKIEMYCGTYNSRRYLSCGRQFLTN